ncbi:MAG: hypothetical protein KAS01_02840 [Candidatus Pacebacteria bacterium]|nr:hypothetical protein [Candidatus Paceibacterota bacterium]
MNQKSKIFIAMLLIVLGVIGRFAFIEYISIPNFEIITTISLIAGIYLGGIYIAIIPLSVIFITDLIIGNNFILLFTWSAFLFISLVGYFFRNKVKKNIIIGSISVSLLSSIFFYLYTNFGWWIMSGMYEHTLSGLLRCYYMALPFFRNSLVGNLILVPIGVYSFSRALVYLKIKNIVYSKLQTRI